MTACSEARRSAGLSGELNSLAVHPDDANVVAAGTEQGLYLSRDAGETFERLVGDVRVFAEAFDLDGEQLWFSTYAGKAGLDRVALKSGAAPETVPIPALGEDAVAYIAQNPAQRDEFAIATFKRSVFVSEGPRSKLDADCQGRSDAPVTTRRTRAQDNRDRARRHRRAGRNSASPERAAARPGARRNRLGIESWTIRGDASSSALPPLAATATLGYRNRVHAQSAKEEAERRHRRPYRAARCTGTCLPFVPAHRLAYGRYRGKVRSWQRERARSIRCQYLGPITVGGAARVCSHRPDQRTAEPTIIHWHGMHVPDTMDGHPRFAIAPGERYVTSSPC